MLAYIISSLATIFLLSILYEIAYANPVHAKFSKNRGNILILMLFHPSYDFISVVKYHLQQ